MNEQTLSLDLRFDVASWRRIPCLKRRLLLAAAQTMERLPAVLRCSSSATVLLTGNAKIRKLNRDFRNIDKETNVLSFPQFPPAEIKKVKKSEQKIEWGDIALAYQYVVAEAKRDDKILIDHVTHLVVHGLLHLFGYDHMDEPTAKQMESLEIRIMKDLGLPNPYE